MWISPKNVIKFSAFNFKVVYFKASTEDEDVEALLEKWVSAERFRAFPKIGGVGLNEMSGLGKMVVIFVADEKEDSSASQKRCACSFG